jgi:hypothetical protein
MKEKLLAVLVMLGILIFPVIFLLAFMIHDRLVLFRTERLREARECLLTGLENIQSGASLTNYDRRYTHYYCEPFLAEGSKYSSVINIGGSNYQCFLLTDDYVNDRGWMGVTTNKVFIFLDYKRGPKIITDSHKAPGWWPGY